MILTTPMHFKHETSFTIAIIFKIASFLRGMSHEVDNPSLCCHLSHLTPPRQTSHGITHTPPTPGIHTSSRVDRRANSLWGLTPVAQRSQLTPPVGLISTNSLHRRAKPDGRRDTTSTVVSCDICAKRCVTRKMETLGTRKLMLNCIYLGGDKLCHLSTSIGFI